MTEPMEGLPRAVAITWGMVADPQRGPKRELSHERIVEAAIGIADAEGLGAVTMSKVAAALGFTTMALYRYVTSKDDLLQLMQDAVAGEIVSGTDRSLDDGRSGAQQADWRTELRRFADHLRSAYRDHAWLGEIPVSEGQLLTPNNLAIADVAMRCMRGLPIADAEKTGVLLLITTYVRAFSLLERDIATSGGLSRRTAAVIKELVTDDQFPDLAPLVRSGAYLAAPADDPVEEVVDYEFGLDRILDGIAAHADGRAQAAAVRSKPGWRDGDQFAEALTLDHVRRDPKVRDAIGKRRDAEARLREARKREREMIKNALERGPRS